jgi:threonine/homoserine/homoserine lactone efflux protein
MFLVMGFELLRRKGSALKADSRLLRPGPLAGFLAGIAVILANPKAILFYMGVLPGFFDLTRINPTDIAAIIAISVDHSDDGQSCYGTDDRPYAQPVAQPGGADTVEPHLRGAADAGVGVVIALG